MQTFIDGLHGTETKQAPIHTRSILLTGVLTKALDTETVKQREVDTFE